NENTVRMRIEFISADMNANGDSLDPNEGFFRIYRVNSNTTAAISWLRGNWPAGYTSSLPTPAEVETCGDWHYTKNPPPNSSNWSWKFYPASVHPTTWFRDTLVASGK